MHASSRAGVNARYGLRKVVRSDRLRLAGDRSPPRIAGSLRGGTCDTIGYMNSQRYKWDDETKDDSPSEFATTAYSTLSGAVPSTWSQDQRRSRRGARRAGLLWTMLAVVSASALALYLVAHWLRH